MISSLGGQFPAGGYCGQVVPADSLSSQGIAADSQGSRRIPDVCQDNSMGFLGEGILKED